MSLPFPHGVAAGDIAEGANKSTTAIPGTVDGRFLAPNENLTSEAINRSAWALSTNIDYLDTNKADIKVIDVTTPNACIGAPPALTFGAGPLQITYGDFWCHINGTIYEISGAVESVSLAYAVLYVDNTGTVQLDEDAAAYPALDPEENIILAYGHNAAGVWDDENEPAMSLTSKPAILTVGDSDVGETNFTTINTAVDFINYLNAYVSNTGTLAANEYYNPTIYVTGPTTMSESVTLEAPLKIVGGPSGYEVYSSTRRTPYIYYDVAGVLFDCGSERIVVENISLVFDQASGPRTDFVFNNVGAYSVFRNVRSDLANPAAPTDLDGFISSEGYLTVDNCYLRWLSSTTANPGISVDDATNTSIIDSYLHTRADTGNEVVLELDDPIRFMCLRSTIIADAAPKPLINITSGSSTIRDVAFKHCKIDASDPAEAALTSTDGNSTGDLIIDSCEIVGAVTIGSIAPWNRINVSNCQELDCAINAEVRNAHLKDSTFNYGSVIKPNDGGVFSFENLKYLLATDEGYGIQIDGEGNANCRASYLFRGCSFNFCPGGTPNTATKQYGIWCKESSATNVSVLEISGCSAYISNSIAATLEFRGFNIASTCRARTINIHDNEVYIYNDDSGGDGLANTIGINVEANGVAYRKIDIADNNIIIDGDTKTQTLTLANTLSSVIGIAAYGVYDIVNVDGNSVEFIDNTAGFATYTGVYTGQNSATITRNRILNACRGIVATECNPGGPTTLTDCLIEHNYIEYGAYDLADTANGFDGACGIMCGYGDVSAPSSTVLVTTANVSNNTVLSKVANNTIVGSNRVSILISMDDGGAGNSSLSFHGNITRDEGPYTGGGVGTYHAWYCFYNAVADIIPNDQGGPAAPTFREHNIYYTNGGAVNSTPAT
jgi:hypothetical protein